MIEVEKKYRITENLEKLIKSSVYLGKEEIHDIYYDFPNYNLIKNEIRFRLRKIKGHSSFELKLNNKLGGDNEIKDEEEIKKYFETKLNIDEFIKESLVVFMEYDTEREKYKNGDFSIDVDKLTSEINPSFIFNVCEIELLTEKEDEITEARLKIKNLAADFSLEKEEKSKREVYLKFFNPNLYDQVFEEKELNKELLRIKYKNH